MRHLWLFFFTWLLLGQSTEPYRIKGDLLGETVAAYQQNHRNEDDCAVRGGLRTQVYPYVLPSLEGCTTSGKFQEMSYAHHRVLSRRVSFDDGRLYSLRMDFSGDTFDQLFAWLSQNFGAPFRIETNLVQWGDGTSTITLKREPTNEDPTTIGLTFSLDALERDAEQKRFLARQNRVADK
jgi:hypothetical protein